MPLDDQLDAPSANSTRAPGSRSRRDVCVLRVDLVVVALDVARGEHERLRPATKLHALRRQAADAQLRSLDVGQDGDVALSAAAALRTLSISGCMLLGIAVREVDAEAVGAGADRARCVSIDEDAGPRVAMIFVYLVRASACEHTGTRTPPPAGQAKRTTRKRCSAAAASR